MQDVTFSIDKIRKKLMELKESSSCGPDGIHPSVLKHSADALAIPLTVIFNMSYTTSCLPSQWLTAHVTPTYKHSGTRLSTENYRHISLTAIVCTIFESILKTEIMIHLLSNKLINSSQHGFLPRRSCQSVLLEIISDWTSALNNKDNSDCIFIDFKEAFDSISHSKLLHKLNSYRLPLLVTKWIKSVLTGRTQQVKIGNSDTLSSSLPCTNGIPQGSALGPILFILFINDLTVFKFSKLMLYADDVTLYATVNNIDANRLQADLDSIALWLQEWQLPINIKKCLFMRIRSASKLDFVYTIGGVNLQLVEHARLLGIILNQNMSVTNQCDNVASQGLKRVFLLLNSFRSSNTSTMISLYKTYVRPNIRILYSRMVTLFTTGHRLVKERAALLYTLFAWHGTTTLPCAPYVVFAVIRTP